MQAPPTDWVEQLAAAAERAGHGGPSQPDAGFAEAPDAIRRIAASIGRMEEALTAALAGQRAAALEMNHRVRNNLQIISSFLNLQAQALPADSERNAIERTRLRVAAIALVHRLILDREDQNSVPSGQLIEAMGALITDSIKARLGFELDEGTQHHALSVETAVPVALWMLEAVEEMAARGSTVVEARIAVRLEAERSELELAVRGHGLRQPRTADAVADRLLDALARQMGSCLERRHPRPAEEEVSVKFPLRRAEQNAG